jgi:hypothetical protein
MNIKSDRVMHRVRLFIRHNKHSIVTNEQFGFVSITHSMHAMVPRQYAPTAEARHTRADGQRQTMKQWINCKSYG